MTSPSPVFAREAVRHEPVRRELRVVRTERLTSTMTRVTVGGEALDGFASVGPEDHVKLFFPAPEGERILRDYTPLAFDAARGELELDFVLHGDSGPATRWATAAKPGDPIVVGGPRGSRRAPAGAGKYVLLADESALPAMSRWITAAGTGTEVLAYVQSAAADVLDYPLGRGDRVAITRIGVDADAALAAVAGTGIDDLTYVWAAGEATALLPVRRHLRQHLGLGKEQAKVDGYWKRGVAGLDHHAPLDPENPDD